MKTWELTEREQVFPFCQDTTDRERQLNCLINNSGQRAEISIDDTNLKFSVPWKGIFYYDTCQDGFVQTFSMVRCSDRKVTVRTGRYIYEMEEERGRRKGEEYEPICRGLTGLDYDGALLSGVHRLPCSWKRNPVVYVQDDIVIDSRGEMMLPQEHRYPYDTELSLISALEWGALCITSDRRVLCRGELTLEEADPALGITTCEHGYLVQTQCGDVYFSTNGRGWQLIGDNASAISASGDLVAWADTEGTVYLYQYGKHNLNCVSVRRFPGRYVTELDVSSRLVALKFLDGRFDVIDWHTGKTALDDLLIAPDFAEE